MTNPKPFNMTIGNLRTIEKVELHPGFRTEKQFEAVRKIVEDYNFDFCCSHKLFVPDETCVGYTCPFNFLWYDKNGILHLTRIGKRGKILREIAA